MGSFLVLEDCSLKACGHHQLNRTGKSHQGASTSASLGFLKHRNNEIVSTPQSLRGTNPFLWAPILISLFCEL